MAQPFSPALVGIEVSKDRHDAHVEPLGEAFPLARDDDGLETLVADLRRRDVGLVVLEATGGLETTVAVALTAAGLPLAVVNPRRSRSFARAPGRLAKTATLRAEAVASCAEHIRPEPRPLAGPDALALAELVARLTAGRDDRHGEEPPPPSAEKTGPREPLRNAPSARGPARGARP